ncbi:hypothetical protein T265_06191 [Opisthorchis viverrini]|uniref:Uncharacterized protein n=1 Tax=Opisthorchis viverrini TaxID=6198 RepID=A0A074ZTB5_OPIVI|nr:hypothetical protein T265_06191 [Opisthorchis viverrini]KER26620.1 hypothetical protein T265_06191 [Opisthorchis viverrini]
MRVLWRLVVAVITGVTVAVFTFSEALQRIDPLDDCRRTLTTSKGQVIDLMTKKKKQEEAQPLPGMTYVLIETTNKMRLLMSSNLDFTQ